MADKRLVGGGKIGVDLPEKQIGTEKKDMLLFFFTTADFLNKIRLMMIETRKINNIKSYHDIFVLLF